MPTFVHGKGARVFAGSVNLTGFLNQASGAASVDVAESTTFGNDDKTYVTGLADATLSGEGYFDAEASGAQETLNAALGAADKTVFSLYQKGDAIGASGAGFSADATAFEPTADLGDVVGFAFEAQSSVGLEGIVSHAAFGTRSTAGTLTTVDGLAASGGFGGAGYLHVTELSGSMAVRIEHSDDDITYATLVNFGTVTAVSGTRVAFTGTAERYTRLVHTPATTGTAAFVAGLARKTR